MYNRYNRYKNNNNNITNINNRRVFFWGQGCELSQGEQVRLI